MIQKKQKSNKNQLPSYFKLTDDQITAVMVAQKSNQSKNIQELALNELDNSILHSEQNYIDFYKILYERNRIKNKNGIYFGSQEKLSDPKILKGQKFYQKKVLNQLEQQQRKKLQKQPGNLQLLEEIYVQFEQNYDNVPIITTKKKDNLLEQKKEKEKIQEYMEDLDHFSKTIKKEKEKQKKKLEQELQAQKDSSINKIAQPSGQARRMSLINYVKSQNNIQNQNKTNVKQLDELKIQELKQQDTLVKEFNQAIKQINNQQKQNQIPYEKNVKVKSEISKYLKSGVNMDEDVDGDGIFTEEGIKVAVEALYINTHIDSFNTVLEKAKFYEKQTQSFDLKLINKISNIEAVIRNKTSAIRILRLENHTIMNKIRDILNLIQQLQDESQKIEEFKQLNQIQAPSNDILQKKQTLFLNIMKLVGFDTSNNMFESKSQVIQQKKSLELEDFLQNSDRQQEIEQEIKNLEMNKKQFQEKRKFNDEIIHQMDLEFRQNHTQLNEVTHARSTFFIETLKIGKDCREEGIAWIIRELWKMGEHIFDLYLPSFLDQRARQFILTKAQKINEIIEIQNLIEASLDFYKTNLDIRQQEEHIRSLKELRKKKRLEDDSLSDSNQDEPLDNHEYTFQDKESFYTQSHPQNKSQFSYIENNIDQSLSIVSNSLYQGKGQQIQLPPISSQNISLIDNDLSNNLSQIDIKSIKYNEIIQKRQKSQHQIITLLDDLDQNNREISEDTINQLHLSKSTTNVIIYDQTKQKIHKALKSWIKTKSKNSSNQLQLINTDRTQDEGYQSLALPHRINLFDNDVQLNKFTNREEFIKEYNTMINQLKEKKKLLKQIEEAETQRIIKEFDFKQYSKIYKTDCSTTLGALIGASQADKIIIRYGMRHK